MPRLRVKLCEECGDEGNRTPDLLNAIQALSHLSYAPGLRIRHIEEGKVFVNIILPSLRYRLLSIERKTRNKAPDI